MRELFVNFQSAVTELSLCPQIHQALKNVSLSSAFVYQMLSHFVAVAYFIAGRLVISSVASVTPCLTPATVASKYAGPASTHHSDNWYLSASPSAWRRRSVS